MNIFRSSHSWFQQRSLRDDWIAEALRRETDVESGKVALVPGHEAVARVRAKLTELPAR